MKNEMPIMKGNFAEDKFNYTLSHRQLLLELDTSEVLKQTQEFRLLLE